MRNATPWTRPETRMCARAFIGPPRPSLRDYSSTVRLRQQRVELVLADDLHTELPGLVELRARVLARHHQVGLSRDRARHLPAPALDLGLRLVARAPRERPGEHDRLACERAHGGDLLRRGRDARREEA